MVTRTRRAGDVLGSSSHAILLAAVFLAASVGAFAPARAVAQAAAAVPLSGPTSAARAPFGPGITRLQVDRIESPTFDGRIFGNTGAYEKLVGRAFGELDVADPRNAGIVNLQRAPRNALGRVEYTTDFYILKPLAMDRGNGTLFYNVVNRGNKGTISTYNVGGGGGNDPSRAAHAGDGLLMEDGYTLVWSGWQGDVAPGNDRMTMQLPVAMQNDGSPIRRRITTEFVFTEPTYSVPVSFDRGNTDVRPYLAVEESMPSATLYQREGPHAPLESIPRNEWSFATCDALGKDAKPSRVDVCLPAGFSPNLIYELVYEARDPMVMGIGLAATRDLVSFLRYDTTAANPLVARSGFETRVQPGTRTRPVIRWALGFGSSQAGRFLKDMIYQGFNQNTAGRIVFDGAIPHISGSRRMFINYEFAMPGRYSTYLEGHYYPGDEFPYTYASLTDPVSGRTGGLLDRCREQNACPRILHHDSGTEPWAGRASLVVTDPLGTRDAALPDNVRVYYFAGTQHGPAAQPERGMCQQLNDPLEYQDTQRALLRALQQWVSVNAPPPPSRHPRIADGTLVPPLPRSAQGFPNIPGVRYTGRPNHLSRRDYSVQPPVEIPGTEYTVLVPRVDADGNEVGGVRSAMLQVPLGTYAGWNLRRSGFMEDEYCYLNGSYIPFAKTAAERGADPRLSLEERYRTHAAYVGKVAAATKQLQRDGFLLPQDAARLIREAEQRELGLP